MAFSSNKDMQSVVRCLGDRSVHAYRAASETHTTSDCCVYFSLSQIQMWVSFERPFTVPENNEIQAAGGSRGFTFVAAPRLLTIYTRPARNMEPVSCKYALNVDILG